MKKEIKLSMEFNPGLQKYEPKLPVRKSKKQIEFNWITFLLIILGILAYILLV